MDRDITGVMLTVACKPVRYQVFAAEEGRWSPTNDLVLNYKGIYHQEPSSMLPKLAQRRRP